MPYPVYPLLGGGEFSGDGGTPELLPEDPVTYWGRFPPANINVILVGSGGGSVGGGGGGGGVVILNNLATDFFATVGVRSPANKMSFVVHGRNEPGTNSASSGFSTVFTTYNSNGTEKNVYTAIGGGFGNSNSDRNENRNGGDGGSGGGAGGSPPNESRSPGGIGSQGRNGGRGYWSFAGVSGRLYYIFGAGGGGGYSEAGTAGDSNFLRLTGGNGGDGISLAPYISSSIQSAFTDGTSLANIGWSGYNSLWVGSGGGGFTSTYNVFAAGEPGKGGGKSILGQHNATGFGCGAACTNDAKLGKAGGGLAIISYAGLPYAVTAYGSYDEATNRTYHIFLGPNDAVNRQGGYFNWTVQM
jgi:hypothetical protein